MDIRTWRTGNNLTLVEMARALGLSGVNPGHTLKRIESGERQPDADMVARIIALTTGDVSPADMHEARLSWLMANRPEKFPAPEAAE